MDIYYEDRNLQRLFEALSEKQRVRALRGAFRREANRVRKVAVINMRQSIHGDRELDRGVRAIVWKHKAGFRVTIGTKRANRKGKGEAGYYISRKRRGKPGATGKPVLLWAEAGTDNRYTRVFIGRRKKHFTGRMKAYGFMYKTRQQVAGSVTENLRKEITDNIKRTAKRYGCT